jgi:hypothetical protein
VARRVLCEGWGTHRRRVAGGEAAVAAVAAVARRHAAAAAAAAVVLAAHEAAPAAEVVAPHCAVAVRVAARAARRACRSVSGPCCFSNAARAACVLRQRCRSTHARTHARTRARAHRSRALHGVPNGREEGVPRREPVPAVPRPECGVTASGDAKPRDDGDGLQTGTTDRRENARHASAPGATSAAFRAAGGARVRRARTHRTAGDADVSRRGLDASDEGAVGQAGRRAAQASAAVARLRAHAAAEARRCALALRCSSARRRGARAGSTAGEQTRETPVCAAKMRRRRRRAAHTRLRSARHRSAAPATPSRPPRTAAAGARRAESGAELFGVEFGAKKRKAELSILSLAWLTTPPHAAAPDG